MPIPKADKTYRMDAIVRDRIRDKLISIEIMMPIGNILRIIKCKLHQALLLLVKFRHKLWEIHWLILSQIFLLQCTQVYSVCILLGLI